MARVCSSGSTEEPTSSRMSRPAAVGSTAASAGRRTPGQRPSPSAAELTVAPVLPAETTASAWPWATASTAVRTPDSTRLSAWSGAAPRLIARRGPASADRSDPEASWSDCPAGAAIVRTR